jgi:hypothetical protein
LPVGVGIDVDGVQMLGEAIDESDEAAAPGNTPPHSLKAKLVEMMV